MKPLSMHHLVVGLLGALAVGIVSCGGGGASRDSVTDPGGSTGKGAMAVALSAATQTVNAGATATLTVTLTRSGSFSGPVTLSITDVPTGVSATFEPSTVSSDATTSTLTLRVAATATPGILSLTVRGQGSGVADATASTTLTIPSIDISIPSILLSMTAGESRRLQATVTGTTNAAVRWSSSVTSVATVSDSGVVSALAPGIATIRARAAADTTKFASVALTVTPASTSSLPGALIASGGQVTGVIGGAGSKTFYRIVVPSGATQLRVATTGGTGDLDLYLRSATTADSSRADCASGNENATERCVVSNPTPGEWSILLHGYTAYSGVTLAADIVTAPTPGFILSTPATSVSVAPGSSTPVVVNLARVGGFQDPVTVKLSNIVAGLSATTATIASSGSNATVTLTATNTAAARNIGLWILGTAGAETRAIVIPLSVRATEAAGFTISPAASSVSIAPGTSASLAVTANRTGGFTGAISLTADGLPNGVTAQGVTIAAGAASGTLTLTASPSAPAGSATATVRASAAGMPDRTASVSVNVTSGSTGGGGVVTAIYTFQSTPGNEFQRPNGYWPEGGLVVGADGNLYGTTSAGGIGGGVYSNTGKGTVFRVTTQGQLTTLVTFEHFTFNGENPRAALTPAADGNFYGLAGDGTFFRVTGSGVYSKVAYSTALAGSMGRLVQGSDGVFYGTTIQGGAQFKGTVFKVTATGTVTTLATFAGANGASPAAGLVEGSDGNFYGTTKSGGASDYGTVFRVTPTGQLSTLVSFSGTGAAGTGSAPRSQLTLGPDGNLYGTTMNGGPGGSGTVFRVTPTGTLTTLHAFNGVDVARGCNCGAASPYAGLMLASDGAFYGTTTLGKGGTLGNLDQGNGAVFRITPAGAYSLVAYFKTVAAGSFVMDKLVQAADGNLYGTASSEGSTILGTVFRVTLGAARR